MVGGQVSKSIGSDAPIGTQGIGAVSFLGGNNEINGLAILWSLIKGWFAGLFGKLKVQTDGDTSFEQTLVLCLTSAWWTTSAALPTMRSQRLTTPVITCLAPPNTSR